MSEITNVVVPDIGDFDAVEVIEILVAVGDTIAADDSIITLESDKASMEIPSPTAGKIAKISVAMGDKLKLGDLILELETNAVESTKNAEQPAPKSAEKPPETAQPKTAPAPAQTQPAPAQIPASDTDSHASPSIRKLARELGADLTQILGTGEKGRVLEDDLKAFVKQIMRSNQVGNSPALPPIPVIDFSKFGDTQTQPLSRINKLSGKHLHACWLNVPHVTQFDSVDISEMDAFRQAQKARGNSLTPLVFIMKAVVCALKIHPRLNASLDAAGTSLILKNYHHLGIAMDTDGGLMVPVIRDVDTKSLSTLAQELAKMSAKARAGKLMPADLQGASFTISSLGGIGGTQFTPIVNAPEVAILGVSRAQTQPVWNGAEFAPKLMLPLALSYDHRVIDGAQGARFMATLNPLLQDIRELLL